MGEEGRCVRRPAAVFRLLCPRAEAAAAGVLAVQVRPRQGQVESEVAGVGQAGEAEVGVAAAP
jgi:hypothetical protein